MIRELEEELRVKPISVRFHKRYGVTAGDSAPNTKHVFVVHIEEAASELTLYEGQELRAIDIDDWASYRFANVLGSIIVDYWLWQGGPGSPAVLMIQDR